MRRIGTQTGIAAALTLVVWLAEDRVWPALVIGAVVALALWVMLFAGSYAVPPGVAGSRGVATSSYAAAAAMTAVLGLVLTSIVDGGAWWSVAAILAGAVVPATRAAARGERG